MSREPTVIVAGDFVCTGGMDRANYALASYLARGGNRVKLVTHRAAPELSALAEVETCRVSKPLRSYFLGEYLLRRSGLSVGRKWFASGGRVVVNGGNCPFPDVNWVHYVHAAFKPSIASSRLSSLKRTIEHPLNLASERRALRAAQLVVCNSIRTQRDVVDRIGVDLARTRVVYYGIDPERFFPVSDDRRAELKKQLGLSPNVPAVLFIGALGDRRKGFDTLFEAWRTLCRSSNWDAELSVVGRGSELALWQARAREAGMGPRIRFLGFRSDVDLLLQAADALVSPTRYEAYGLGVHEALCCGLPAFVSAEAGVAECYPEDLQKLLLPDPEDAADLVDRLLKWRCDPKSLMQSVVALSQQLRRRTWDDMAREFLGAMDGASA